MPDPVKIEQKVPDTLMTYTLMKQIMEMINPLPKPPGMRPDNIPTPQWSVDFAGRCNMSMHSWCTPSEYREILEVENYFNDQMEKFIIPCTLPDQVVSLYSVEAGSEMEMFEIVEFGTRHNRLGWLSVDDSQLLSDLLFERCHGIWSSSGIQRYNSERGCYFDLPGCVGNHVIDYLTGVVSNGWLYVTHINQSHYKQRKIWRDESKNSNE